MALSKQLTQDQVDQFWRAIEANLGVKLYYGPFDTDFKAEFKRLTGQKLVHTTKGKFFVKFKDEHEAVQFKLTWL